MNIQKVKNQIRARRAVRVRAKISGTAACPRLSVHRTLRGMYAQLIDDQAQKTLVSASTDEVKGKHTKTEAAAAVGKLLAGKAVKASISQVVFDRSHYKFHGRVKALAEGARSGGLVF